MCREQEEIRLFDTYILRESAYLNCIFFKTSQFDNLLNESQKEI